MNWNEFTSFERATKDTIDVKKCYIDLAGEIVAGVMLSQIVYWNLPNKHGKSKLRVKKRDMMWIAKSDKDWWEEIRLTEKQARRSRLKLEEKMLIKSHTYKFNGTPMTHIRIQKRGFTKQLNELLKNGLALEGESDLPQRADELDSQGKSLTESTAETTTKTKVKKTASQRIINRWNNLASKDSKLTSTRKTNITATLRDYSFRELCYAIANLHKDKWARENKLVNIDRLISPKRRDHNLDNLAHYPKHWLQKQRKTVWISSPQQASWIR